MSEKELGKTSKQVCLVVPVRIFSRIDVMAGVDVWLDYNGCFETLSLSVGRHAGQCFSDETKIAARQLGLLRPPQRLGCHHYF